MAVPRSIARDRSLYHKLLQKSRRKIVRKRALRVGFVISNLVLLIGIAIFVTQTRTSGQIAAPISTSTSSATATNPLDQVSSADIALTVARMTSVPETTAVANEAQSEAADIAATTTSDNVITKPQVVNTAEKSIADVQTYTTVAGDSVTSLATKFGVTSNSIEWSNGLNGPTLNPGTKLRIPPVNGIVYTVKDGDTVASLATKFQSNQASITAFNDAEINGINPGEQIVIPDGSVTSAPASYGAATSGNSFAWGGDAPVYGYNGYDYGYCTWYVASQIAVPSNWGNATSWDQYARMSGWNVSNAPTVGAIAQKHGG
ncbi:MAG: LysM peptidoglycan-binding domain-containing protein, partial [Candidatus Saccharimonadales bacterium]